MKSTKVQNPRRKCSAVVDTNCLVAEYRIPYRIGPRTIITHAHRAPLIDGWATQRGPRPRLVATSRRLASCVIVSRFRTALDLDTYPLSNFIRPRCAEWAKRGRGKPVLIMHNYWLFRISLKRSRFSKIATLFS